MEREPQKTLFFREHVSRRGSYLRCCLKPVASYARSSASHAAYERWHGRALDWRRVNDDPDTRRYPGVRHVSATASSAAQRAVELYAGGGVMRRELRDFGVDCVALSLRSGEGRDKKTVEKLLHTRRSTVTQSGFELGASRRTRSTTRWRTVTSTNGTWSATLSCGRNSRKNTHASAFISSIA